MQIPGSHAGATESVGLRRLQEAVLSEVPPDAAGLGHRLRSTSLCSHIIPTSSGITRFVCVIPF